MWGCKHVIQHVGWQYRLCHRFEIFGRAGYAKVGWGLSVKHVLGKPGPQSAHEYMYMHVDIHDMRM